MQDGEVRFATMEDWRVAYEVRGRGDGVIVLVHGYSASRVHWHHQLDGIDAGRRVVSIDLLGHGESDAPEIEYTMELFARSVAAVLNDIDAERAVLVGHSNGVPVVRQFYRMFPERTEAMIAVDGALKPIPREHLEMMVAPMRQPDWRDTFEKLVAQTATVAGNTSADDVEMIQRVTLDTAHHVLIGAAEAMMDASIWVEDPIAVPLMVLASKGPYSDIWTEEYQSYVRGIAPQVEYHVWEDATHMLIMEFPDRFNRLVEQFVAKLGTP